jgi:serine phosphatase RsbU (regulator of sigma subunit)/pSer/pThr/pTyr-binding forkhead associated (FHA) protein
MASLHVLKGLNTEGQRIPLEGDRLTMGRNPDCYVHIPITSVSREHAAIIREQGRFYIEDLQSRNGTFVNNQQINARTPLRHNDRIRICDFLATFQDASSTLPLPASLRDDEEELDDEPETSSTVEATLSHSSQLLQAQPAEKLQALLDISSNLSKTLELDPLLPKIVENLFQLFRQADRCFIILVEEGTGKLIPKVIKTRRPHDEANARFSRSIVRKCIETSQAFLSDDASADKRIPLSQSVVDFRIRSVMCAPLAGAQVEGAPGKAFGVIQLDTQDRSKKFTQEDLTLLLGVCNVASMSLENARMHESALAQERVKRDLELAHQVQLGFLPQKLPEVPGYEFFAHYESALEVGGDYYDFVPLGGKRLAITLGDVAGKGVTAALLMAKLSSDARFCLLTEPDLPTAVQRLNDLLLQHAGKLDRFVTLGAIVLDPQAHSATLVSAGHMAPLLYRQANGSVEDAMPKDVAGMPLGIMEAPPIEAYSVSLQPGDCLLLYTDGVTDAVNLSNAQFGRKGMELAFKGADALAPRSLCERLMKAVKQHSAGRAQHDDITLVALGRTA